MVYACDMTQDTRRRAAKLSACFRYERCQAYRNIRNSPDKMLADDITELLPGRILNFLCTGLGSGRTKDNNVACCSTSAGCGVWLPVATGSRDQNVAASFKQCQWHQVHLLGASVGIAHTQLWPRK